jgi:PAS domain S-box-containing protein
MSSGAPRGHPTPVLDSARVSGASAEHHPNAVNKTRPTRHVQNTRTSVRRYQAAIEMVPEASLLVDADGCIQLANRQAEMLFGYARRHLVGHHVQRVLPEWFHIAQWQERTRRVSGAAGQCTGTFELFGRRSDGAEFSVEVQATRAGAAHSGLVIATVYQARADEEWSAGPSAGIQIPQHLTHLANQLSTAALRSFLALHAHDEALQSRVHAAQRAAEETRAHMQALQDLTDTVLAHLDLEALLPALLERVRRVMAIDIVGILLLDEGGQQLSIRAALGMDGASAANTRVPVGHGFAGHVAATRQPLVVDDMSLFPSAHPVMREWQRSAMGVPLLARDRLLGIIHVGTIELRHFTHQDVELLQRVAERVATAIERAQLYETEQRARRDAEAALAQAQASGERARRIVEAGIIGTAVGRGRVVLEANEVLLGMLGYTRDDLATGQLRWNQLLTLHNVNPAAAERRARREMLARGTYTPIEHDLVRADGTSLPVLIGAALLSRDSLEWVCYVVDMRDRKRLEREREAARANELAVREVNRHLDEFFTTAAHDLRSPAAVAKGQAEIAIRHFERLAQRLNAQGGVQKEEATNILATLEKTSQSIDRLSRLTTELFDVARARTGTLELHLAAVDLVALVREQVLAQRVATPGRAIRLSLSETAPAAWVQGDAMRLGQVLTNYLTNALKYSAADKPIEVSLEVVEQLAVVSVRDEGPGLPWEEQGHVWDMFHRVPGVEVRSGPEGSLGMGLYICKRLMDLHPGGRVGVESTVGEGSTFWFRLPVASAASANLHTTGASARG